MKYKVILADSFKKEAKKLLKKYPSLRSEIEILGNVLLKSPFSGKQIGKGFYKIRLAIKSKGKGKQGGARVITYVKVVETTVYLVSIYDKSEKSAVTDSELDTFFAEIFGG